MDKEIGRQLGEAGCCGVNFKKTFRFASGFVI